MLKRTFCLLFLLLILFPNQITKAQDSQPTGPVYVVQSGDTFYSIAIEFGVTINDIVKSNPDVNPNALAIGQEIIIPGLEGIQGKLVTETIPLGESLRTLSIRNQVARDQIGQLNHITSPAEVFAGADLIVPEKENFKQPQSRYLLAKGQSLFQVAAQNKVNPWLLAEINQTGSTWDVLPGEAIFDQAADTAEQVNLISPVIKELTVDPLPIEQGETNEIKISTTQPIELTGSLAGHALHFFPNGENAYVALQGVHAMADPGIYPFTLEGKLQDGTHFSFEQMVILKAMGYASEKIQGVDPATLDPANTKPEEDQVNALVAPATPEKYWTGAFSVPGYDPNWITSWYGTRRSYNGGPISAFHTGVDYGGGIGLPVKAAAPGVVVFAGPLTVRGNATYIDHGWGVYSAYFHQSEFKVKVGDRVEAGQVIGLSGGTGRITGPHLHWEIWVNGVQVNPLTWLEKVFP
jgi:murein DD-endopeptidase MepM/ murein hydrolase activator NlpD